MPVLAGGHKNFPKTNRGYADVGKESQKTVRRLVVNIDKIGNVSLSDEQKKHCLDRLDQVNNLIRKWSHLQDNMTLQDVRVAMLDQKRTHLLNCPPDRRGEFLADVEVVRKIRDEDPLLDNRSVEFAILQNYSNMAMRFSKLWMKKNHANQIEFEDFLQECYIQIMDTMFKWSRDGGADMTTYIWWSLKNRLINVVNQQGCMLSHLTNEDMRLHTQINQMREGSMSTEEKIKSMNLSDKHEGNLRKAMASLQTMLDCDVRITEKNHPSLVEKITDEEQEFVDMIIEESDLTNFERELIHHAMNPFYGWQSQLAKRICPRTQRRYGRQKIGTILKSAREKVARTYERYGS